MKIETLEKLIWSLIYGGLIAVGLGLSVQRTESLLGHAVIAMGAIAAAAGVVLIYVRSRRRDPVQPNDKKPSP